ncbi:MAG: sigma 54-interacting transcriptional regulator [Myxococcales bacterium]|nr:sigma 54-interacting transcriptional regulator [Myxococcales bacterium]
MAAPADTLTLEVVSGARAGLRATLALPAAIGRAPSAGLQLPDAHLSGQHGRIERAADGAVRFLDLGSSNGSVHRRGDRQTELVGANREAELWQGDELWLGDPDEPVIVRVHLDEAAEDEIIARRSIDGVAGYADRLAARPGRLGVLYRHTLALGTSVDLDAVLQVAARLVFELLPRATHLAIALEERGGRFPVMLAQRRDGGEVEIPVSRTLLRRVLDERAGLLLTNAQRELSDARSAVQAGLASTLAVPLWTSAQISGVIQVDNRDAPGLFSGDDLEVLTVAASNISFAAENARLVARLRLAEQRLDRENRYLKQKEQAETYSGIIGDSAAMQAVLDAVEKVRDTRVPVLITGETGTGKELVARALHYGSQRKERLFVAQNCSALPENLLESELFGHVRGAFTGADRDKKGLFELADGGTIFLDELGEMPLALQAKLLRVVQEGEIWPLGAPRPKRIDVRIVSATHRDLEQMVRERAFREDLFYRLHVYPIHLPPLRARRDDIPALARHFIARYSKEFGRPTNGFTPEALARLRAYDWPGNVRELQNELQRVLIQRIEGDLVLVEDLSPRILGQTGVLEHPDVPSGSLKEMMDAVERVLLLRALRENDENKTQTARMLGITREGLHKKLARFGLT